MFSIRNCMMIALLGAMGLTAGCTTRKPNPPATLSPAPINNDAAISKRNWPQSKATYPTGNVPAKADRALFQSEPRTRGWIGWLTETPIFVGNTALIPVTWVTRPPTQVVVHPAEVTPPTYTAMPPTETIYGGRSQFATGTLPSPVSTDSAPNSVGGPSGSPTGSPGPAAAPR